MNEKIQKKGKRMKSDEQDNIEALQAAAFRQLVAHLQRRSDVQNIDLMNLAGFCRNCLSKWYKSAAEASGVALDYEQAREVIYGMPYAQWKSEFQIPLPADAEKKSPQSE